jgi:polysaccharide deacetylase 2 family uncharacterized protein YibQ
MVKRLALLLAAALALLVGLAWWALRPAPPAGGTGAPGQGAGGQAQALSSTAGAASQAEVLTPTARLALVIDDWGYLKVPVERLKNIRFQLTTSILPNLPYSRASAEASHAGGHQVILHCPMQSVRSIAKERNTLLVTMSPAQARAALQADWDSVPWLEGMNNHEGSRASADRALMDVAAAFLKEKGAFFLDSVTTNHSAIPAAAKAAGVPWARRRVFLDNVDKASAVEAQLKLAVALARKDGQCIAIGHPKKNTLDVLERLAPGLAAQGITLVKVGDLVHP